MPTQMPLTLASSSLQYPWTSIRNSSRLRLRLRLLPLALAVDQLAGVLYRRRKQKGKSADIRILSGMPVFEQVGIIMGT